MTNSQQQRIVLIAGPTGSGKSDAAVAIAEQLGGIVVNADALQVYEDLNIISARPGPQDQARAPHHLFGHVGAAVRYSVGKWLKDIQPVLLDAAKRKQPAVVIGGTGLYFKALLEGLSDIPDVPAAITGRWNRQLKEQGPWALHAILMAQDPETADELEPSDSQRIVRALAVKQSTGKPFSHFQAANSKPLVSAQDVVVRTVLLPDREQLYDRIEARFDAMIAAGALDEVKTLLARNLPRDLPAMKAIGVPELAAFLADEQSLDEAIEKAKTNSRRYAKRQTTWIRGQMEGWTLFTAPQGLVRQCLDVATHRA